MRCRDVQKIIPLLGTDELDVVLEQQIGLHLKTCTHCHVWFNEHNMIVKQLESDTGADRSDQFYQRLEKSIIEMVRQPEEQSLLRRFRSNISDIFLFNPDKLRYGFSAVSVMLVIGLSLFYLSGQTVHELNPDIALSVCDDPDIWSSAFWTDENSEQSTYTDDVASDNVHEIIYEEIFQDDPNTSLNDTELEDDSDIWSLIDKLDENGIQLLVRELEQVDRV